MQTLHFPRFPLLSPHACFLSLGFTFQVRNELLVGDGGFFDRKNKCTEAKELFHGTVGEEVAWVIVYVRFVVVNKRYVGHNGFNVSTLEALRQCWL